MDPTPDPVAEETPAATPAERFLGKADRLMERLAAELDRVEAQYGRLRAETLDLADFLIATEPAARRILELDRRFPVPPDECVGEEAVVLLALQAAENAVLQITVEELHHPSFQASLRKSRRHLDDYRAHRARHTPPA